MEHQKPAVLKKPRRAHWVFAVVLGVLAVAVVSIFIVSMTHHETKAPAPERGSGVAPLEQATPGTSKPGSPG